MKLLKPFLLCTLIGTGMIWSTLIRDDFGANWLYWLINIPTSWLLLHTCYLAVNNKPYVEKNRKSP